MSEKVTDIQARHDAAGDGRRMDLGEGWQAHDDRGVLLDEIREADERARFANDDRMRAIRELGTTRRCAHGADREIAEASDALTAIGIPGYWSTLTIRPLTLTIRGRLLWPGLPPSSQHRTLAGMIKFDFDRDRVTPREAQIVSAILATHYNALTFIYQGLAAQNSTAPKREVLEGYAEKVRKISAAEFPDLAIRWEWQEPSE